VFSHIVQWCAIAAVVCLSFVMHLRTQQRDDDQEMQQQINIAILNDESHARAVTDINGTIIRWNVAMEQLTGYSLEEINRLGIGIMMPPPFTEASHHAQMMRAFSDPKMHGKTILVHCSVVTKGGERIPVRVSVAIYDPPTGKPFGVTRIDRESQIVEIGEPSGAVEKRVFSVEKK